MATIEQRTRLARLLVAAPEVVYEELKNYSAEVIKAPFRAGSKELEESLLSRDDPLINLGLASFGCDPEVVGELWRKGMSLGDDVFGGGLRVAVLSNQTLDSRASLSRFPQNVLGEENVAHVLKEAQWPEVEALVQNPTISDDVLRSLYRGDAFADGIDEARRRQLVSASGQNERLLTREDTNDGPDMGHYYIQKDIFGMLEAVPTSKEWVRVLRWLLECLDPENTANPDDITAVLERWKLNENGQEDEPEKKLYTVTGLTEREELRCLISAIYGTSYRRKSTAILGSPDDEDVALRCSYYGNAKLTIDTIKVGYERDKEVFVLAAMMNHSVFHDRKLRQVFEDECLNGSWRYQYDRRLQQIKRRWPYFDTRPMAEWMVEQSKPEDGDLLRPQVEALQAVARKLGSVAALLPWLVGVVAILALWR